MHCLTCVKSSDSGVEAYDWLMEPLVIDAKHEIPGAELIESFSTSGGPGGQHANRSSTRVTLTFDLGESEVFDDLLKGRLRRNLGHRLTKGVLVVAVDDSRSQWRNRQLARSRMRGLLVAALRTQKVRRPTRPTRSAKRKRVDEKKARGETKRLRSRPRHDDPQ